MPTKASAQYHLEGTNLFQQWANPVLKHLAWKMREKEEKKIRKKRGTNKAQTPKLAKNPPKKRKDNPPKKKTPYEVEQFLKHDSDDEILNMKYKQLQDEQTKEGSSPNDAKETVKSEIKNEPPLDAEQSIKSEFDHIDTSRLSLGQIQSLQRARERDM